MHNRRTNEPTSQPSHQPVPVADHCPKKKEERDDNPEKREKLQDPGVM